MPVENTTIARPYAEAVFERAQETDSLDAWTEALTLLAAVVADPRLAAILANPQVERAQGAGLVIDIGGDNLGAEARNLVRLLAENRRLPVLPEIAALYEILKSEGLGSLDVHVTSAYKVSAAQEKLLADALQAKLGLQVRVTSDKDPSLIAGLIIRAGDLVIDGSFKGHLGNLASELGI
jgi:F-type H+-transporting ATPase subunit delta